MSHLPVIDPGLCPLCGQPNRCAMACAPQPDGLDGPEANPPTQGEPCWCTRVQFSERLLQQVPAAAKNKACICPRCAASPAASGKD